MGNVIILSMATRHWKEYLTRLGFSDNEASLYLTSLKEGQLSVQELSRKTKLSRVTVYAVLESLMKRGLISTVQKGKKNYYAAEPPERLFTVASQEIGKLEVMVEEMKQNVSELRAIQSGDKPVVKMFEGEEAMLIFQEKLLSAPVKEFYEFGNIDAIRNAPILGEVASDFFERMDKKKIVRYGMFSSKEKDPISKSDFEKVKKLENIDEYSGNVSVFGDEVIISGMSGKFISVYIQNKEIADTVRALLRKLWKETPEKEIKKTP
ncbi:BlaI/MecI/CopY family transcriptional regulator [Candidatus Nomurabacteria bacterium]|nr:BlaI/MecI/CopY family transcriptional regulator [Candidatus Nomurabacteria bacterium]